MAIIYPLYIDAGATFTRQFEYLYTDDEPVDLTGFTALFQIRQKPNTALILQTEPEIDLETATVSLILTAAETSLLTASEYVYGLELIDEGGEPVIRLAGGACFISAEVVREEE
jgi:hypothetical protein